MVGSAGEEAELRSNPRRRGEAVLHAASAGEAGGRASLRATASVSKDCLVRSDNNKYSVAAIGRPSSGLLSARNISDIRPQRPRFCGVFRSLEHDREK